MSVESFITLRPTYLSLPGWYLWWWCDGALTWEVELPSLPDGTTNMLTAKDSAKARAFHRCCPVALPCATEQQRRNAGPHWNANLFPDDATTTMQQQQQQHADAM